MKWKRQHDSTVVPFERDEPADRNRPGTESRASAEHVTRIGKTIVVKGEIHASEHIIIDGQFEGTIDLPDHGVAVGSTGKVDGYVFARTVTVLGRVLGTITAAARAEIRDIASIDGRLVAPRIIMEEGARFQGVIDTKRATVATKVARYRVGRKGAS